MTRFCRLYIKLKPLNKPRKPAVTLENASSVIAPMKSVKNSSLTSSFLEQSKQEDAAKRYLPG